MQSLPPIVFNYLGQFDSKETATDNAHWSFATELSGESVNAKNQSDDLISINGGVHDGCLQFAIHSKLDQSTAKALSAAMQYHLQQIIKHCLAQTKKGIKAFTPSDFPETILKSHWLDAFQKQAYKKQRIIQAIYPANSLQRGFIYHALAQADDDAYCVQSVIDLSLIHI